MSKFQMGDKVTLNNRGEEYDPNAGSILIGGNIGEVVGIDSNAILVTNTSGNFWYYPYHLTKVGVNSKGTEIDNLKWTDKHYDFNYTLTQADIERGSIKLDPYFVYGQWNLHEVDKYGVLMHQIKTLSRFGRKNDIMREIDALIGQATRLKQLVENEKPVENENE